MNRFKVNETSLKKTLKKRFGENRRHKYLTVSKPLEPIRKFENNINFVS
jgi:hypothetical protein